MRSCRDYSASTGSTAAQNLYTAIRSDNAEAHSGSLTNRFDKDQVQKELDIQREVTQSFSRNIGEAKTEVNKQIDELKAKKDAGEISEAEYNRKLQNLQYLNVAISSLSGALMAPTDSVLGIAAAAGSPVVAYHIGQRFKQNDELNKLDGGHRPGEGSKEHIALHTLNGILTGAAGGNNAVLSGLSAGGAELLAPALAQTLYNKSSKDLNAEEKATISSLTAVFGAAVGAASGDVSDAVAGSQAAQNAVGNNYNLWQEKLLSGDYYECITAGGSDSACGNYQPLGLPHFIAVEIALPQGLSVNKSTKIAINTRDGSIYMGVAGGLNDSQGSGKLGLSASAGWVANLSSNDRAILNKVINDTLGGVSVGGKGCLVGGCIGVSRSVASTPVRYTFEFGTGTGISVGSEAMGKIGQIKLRK